MKKKLNLLFGINEPVVDAVLSKLTDLGYEVVVSYKYTKAAICDYVNAHPECEAVILREVLDNSRYSANELSALTDNRDINVVIVVGGERRGTDFMSKLYAAGITGAIFQHTQRGGASALQLVDLILHKRTRKQARQYYAISEGVIDLDVLPFDLQMAYVEGLSDPSYGRNVTERFTCIASRLTPHQLEEYISMLPNKEKAELEKYAEYYEVLEELKKNKIDIPYKKPRKLLHNSKVLRELEKNMLKDTPKEPLEHIFEDLPEDDDDMPDLNVFIGTAKKKGLFGKRGK